MKAPQLAMMLAVFVILSVFGRADQVLQNQPFDQTGSSYASQNDTNQFGLFAQAYDNFRYSASDYTVHEVQFTGNYFNPAKQGLITGWTVNIYADDAGQPGNPLYSLHVSGTGGETFLGSFDGLPAYAYDVAGLNFAGTAHTNYWLDVYPDLGYHPQWGWATSATGLDDFFYGDLFGLREGYVGYLAFTVIGSTGRDEVPEPAVLILIGTGALGVATVLRRRIG